MLRARELGLVDIVSADVGGAVEELLASLTAAGPALLTRCKCLMPCRSLEESSLVSLTSLTTKPKNPARRSLLRSAGRAVIASYECDSALSDSLSQTFKAEAELKVADAAVVGAPHEEMGEQVVAVIQPMDMEAAGDALEEPRRRVAEKEAHAGLLLEEETHRRGELLVTCVVDG